MAHFFDPSNDNPGGNKSSVVKMRPGKLDHRPLSPREAVLGDTHLGLNDHGPYVPGDWQHSLHPGDAFLL